MPYTLIRFDDVPLPDAMPAEDLGTGRVESSLLNSVGGTYNYWGAAQHLPRIVQFEHRGLYVADGAASGVDFRVTDNGDFRVTNTGDFRVTSPSRIADLQGKSDDLKAKIGVWGALWRRRMQDDALTWKRCRLLEVAHAEDVEKAGVVLEVKTTFETMQPGWKAQALTTASVNVSSQVTRALDVQNAGSLSIVDALLRVTRTGGTLTQVRVSAPGIDWVWNGSYFTGSLVIDAGMQTVSQGGVDAYSGLSFGAGQTRDEWLYFAPGVTSLLVTVTGGSAAVDLEYYNAWA